MSQPKLSDIECPDFFLETNAETHFLSLEARREVLKHMEERRRKLTGTSELDRESMSGGVKCNYCGQNSLRYQHEQTRSADEPETITGICGNQKCRMYSVPKRIT